MKKIDLELKELSANPQNIKDYSRFHKDGKQRLGIAASIIRKLSSRYFKEIKHEEKQLILSLCTRMLDAGKSSYMEIAFDWAFRLEKHYQSEDFEIFESWLENHVDNWGSCDDLCTHAFGAFLFRFPEFLPRAEQWTKSTSKWVRRASAVVLIFSLRRMKHLKEALKVAENLLSDSEDLVQKGLGWMLKEASRLQQKEVADFVIRNKKTLSRTALRYAVEKFPPSLKTIALSK